MINQQRRAALKLMATGAAIASASPLLASQTMTTAPLATNANSAHLQIDILAGDSVPDDSIIIRNLTTDALVIEDFRPGVIVHKDSIIDLNELCRSGPLNLSAGGLRACTVAEWHSLAAPAMQEYLTAESAATPLSANTDVISLVAVVQHRQAVAMLPGIA